MSWRDSTAAGNRAGHPATAVFSTPLALLLGLLATRAARMRGVRTRRRSRTRCSRWAIIGHRL